MSAVTLPHRLSSLSSPVFNPRPPAQPGPTRFRVADLLQTTDRIADNVLCGQYDGLLPVGGVPTDQRWFARLYGDEELDVWLISWVPGRSTTLHDHAGSLGALTLLSGALSEYRWDGRQLRYRRLEAGDQAGFPLGWVHDVVWAQPTSDVGGPTLSVHAYSPPLTAMSYYSVNGSGRLRRERTELTELPEGE